LTERGIFNHLNFVQQSYQSKSWIGELNTFTYKFTIPSVPKKNVADLVYKYIW
jgi:hypothetical protein